MNFTFEEIMATIIEAIKRIYDVILVLIGKNEEN